MTHRLWNKEFVLWHPDVPLHPTIFLYCLISVILMYYFIFHIVPMHSNSLVWQIKSAYSQTPGREHQKLILYFTIMSQPSNVFVWNGVNQLVYSVCSLGCPNLHKTHEFTPSKKYIISIYKRFCFPNFPAKSSVSAAWIKNKKEFPNS